MNYSQRIDRTSPALMIFLIDQSDSMNEPAADVSGQPPRSKAQAVADHLDALLYELVLRCVKTPRETPRDYFHIGTFGYSTDPAGETELLDAVNGPSSLGHGLRTTADLATNPRSVRTVAGPGGGQVKSPAWVEPFAQGGTPMCAALNHAGQVVAQWVASHRSSFPPIIINLSDGEATDGDATVWAQRLRSLGTDDGAVLLFNINLSTTGGPVALFPSSPDALPDVDAQRLFHMSSDLPEVMMSSARSQAIPVAPGARGFAYNADPRALASFLNIGTSVGRAAR